MSLRKSIDHYCNERGISQNEIHRQTGVTTFTLTRMKNEDNANLANIRKVCKCLGVKLSEFFASGGE